MKKVTIITPPEYEGLVLESLGRARVTQLKSVSGPEFEGMRLDESKVDYEALYNKVHPRYEDLMELSEEDIERIFPSKEALRRFSTRPEEEISEILGEMEQMIDGLKKIKEEQQRVGDGLITELQKLIEEENSAYEEEREKLESEASRLEKEKEQIEDDINKTYAQVKVKLESVKALEPEELKSCFAVGLVRNEHIPKLEEYMKRYKDLYYRAVGLGRDKSFLFVFGSEEGRKWVEALFLVFEVEDIFDVLDAGDILLVLDSERRKEAIAKYEQELNKIEKDKDKQTEREREYDKDIGETRYKLQEIEKEHNENIDKLKEDYESKINQTEKRYEKQIEGLKSEQSQVLGKIAYMNYLLRILSDKRAPVMRTKVISVLQGWVPDYKVKELEDAIKGVETMIGERLFTQFEEPSQDDHNIPNPEPRFKPSFLQPAWILTKLRGWPSPTEINPGYIAILVFSFQFGLMYGDIGQGLVFLALGIFLSRKYKKRMMSRLGGLFIPMGISAMIFGTMYDSIFLVEGLLFHHHQILPNPVHSTTKLMLIVFQIAAIEVIFGLVLGAINQIKEGNPIGALGEHGLGMILYVGGLYLTAVHFINIGMDFMGALSNWTFYLAISGIVLSFLEPVLHSVRHGHGLGMEAIGEGVGGLLMTFVEGLANLFSFLRIAAFALAHASLAIAAEALSHSLGVAGIGLIIMNIIAMSFEFISSTVQSLRLLYYEFMGKFFHGEGVPFAPYRLKREKRPGA